jgi:KDO2-lipid IV(A) lauroyltransferase
LGVWELLPLLSTMELKGWPANIVYRPLDYAPLEEFIVRHRTQFGAKLIKKSNALGEILKCLKRGELVALLMDQNVGWRKGVFAEFFGHRACTNKGLALLALKTRAPVVPLFLVREKSSYSVHIGEALPLITTGDRTKDLEANTQQYNTVIESFVRRFPDQWLWVHQRWKTRPYKPWPRK